MVIYVDESTGDVVAEFWKGDRKLTLYASTDSLEFVKVSGPDVETDMEDGSVVDIESLGTLVRWLGE